MTSQSDPMSPDGIEERQKRKRSVAGWNACRVKKAKLEEQQASCDYLEDYPSPALYPDRTRLDEQGVSHGCSPLPIIVASQQQESVDDILKSFFEDIDSAIDDESPGYSSTTDLGTPDTVYSAGTETCLLTGHSSPTTNQQSSCTSASRIRESQQAFTIYTSSSTSHRKYKGPTSLQAFSQWLQLNSDGLGLDFSEHFRHGTRHSEEMDMPPFLSMPALCTEWHVYADTYFDEIAPFFPVIGREEIIRAATNLSRYDALEERPISDRPAMACVYACISLGARTKGHTGIAQAYIEGACSLVGYLNSSPYLQSAQALLLISLEHRGRSKCGAASMALGQALRILNSMGLHQKLLKCKDYLSPARQRSDRRTWLAAYALEQTLAFESGRLSSIQSCQMGDKTLLNTASNGPADYLKAFVGLAQIQRQITERLFDQSVWASPPDLEYMLEVQGQLDDSLTRWSDDLPELWQPHGRLPRCPPTFLAFRASLTFQFHQALIVLHRMALLDGSPVGAANSGVEGNHARRLQKSEGICANSARDILTTYLDFIEQGQPSPLVTLTQPLLAVYVLTIYTLRHPNAWSTNIDLTLLSSGAKAVRDGYRDHGMPPGFCDMLTILERRAVRGGRSRDEPTGTSYLQQQDAQDQNLDQVASETTLSSGVSPLGADAFVEPQLLASLQDKGSAPQSSNADAIRELEEQETQDWLDSPQLSFEEILSYRL